MDMLAELRPGFTVLPIAIDSGGVDDLRRFYAGLGLRNLGIYQDHSGALARAAGVYSYPTTVLVDAEGIEVDRVLGAIHWSSPEVLSWLDTLLGQGAKEV